MQFQPVLLSQVSDTRHSATVVPNDRDCPLDTARDRCLWLAGGTAGENDEARTWRYGSQLA
jgi:hypothetical protein